MTDLEKLRQRFTRDNYQVRMGNLASNLLRLSSTVKRGGHPDLEKKLLWEICWMAEWIGENTPVEIADMQRELCRWRRVWPLKPARSLLALRSGKLSDIVLELSGLVASRAGSG